MAQARIRSQIGLAAPNPGDVGCSLPRSIPEKIPWPGSNLPLHALPPDR
jgi:hypothetical protein